MAKNVLLVPFDKNGNLLPYVDTLLSPAQEEYCLKNGSCELYIKDVWPGLASRCPERKNEVAYVFRPNSVFEDALVMTGYTRGCSAARLVFKSERTGCTCEMFLTDFEQAVLSSRIEYKDEKQKGIRLVGRFTYVKRGQNYGVRKIN